MLKPKKLKIAVLCVEMQSIRLITATLRTACELAFGRDAKSLLAQASADVAPFAVIVDNSVPQLNAIETLHSMKTVLPQAKRILVTEHCDLGIIVQGLHTGAVQSIVYKPVHPSELLGALGFQHSAGFVNPTAHAPQQTRAAG